MRTSKICLGRRSPKSEQDPVRFWSRHMTTVTHGLPPREKASDGQRTKELGNKYKLLWMLSYYQTVERNVAVSVLPYILPRLIKGDKSLVPFEDYASTAVPS